MRHVRFGILAATAMASPLFSQPAPSAPVTRGAPASSALVTRGAPVTLSASLRVRAESWDWFDAGAAGEYSYAHALARVAAARATGRWQWRLEAAVPVLMGLPDDATLPAPAGQLGLGSTLYAANDSKRNVTGVFVKQAFVRWANAGKSLRVGRFEFGDGAERAAADPSLAAVKAQRVGQRLIGPFGFSAVGRAFDGAHFAADWRGKNLTLVAASPTAGAFRVDGQPGLNVDMAYAAISRGARSTTSEQDMRLFGLWYADDRGRVPTDNRSAAARNADRGRVDVLTVGAHWAAVRKVGAAKFDVLAWGALQSGNWGRLDHAAHAAALEAGVQHSALPWGAWLRAGWLQTSGDDASTDDRHETFFQVLPTPRVYARFPFYNMMNSSEAFVTVQAKPHARVTLRAGMHDLRLTEAADLWYLGGGAFDARVFGFTGRASSASTSLATVTDLSIAWQAHKRVAVELYGAVARGGAVVKGAYSGSRDARFVYLETTLTR